MIKHKKNSKERWFSRKIKKYCVEKPMSAFMLKLLINELEGFISDEFNAMPRGGKESLIEQTPDDQLLFDSFLPRLRPELDV